MSKDAAGLLEETAHRWEKLSGHKAASLLKLALLRDLARDIHRGKSDHLARQSTTKAQDLVQLEDKIESLRTREIPDSVSLPEFISHPTLAETSSRSIPASFFNSIPRDRIFRDDRTWEATLIAEGLDCGWRLWKVDATMPLTEVEKWNLYLNQNLWPWGICLFAEAGKQSAPLKDRHWLGKWFCLLHPRFKKPRHIPLIPPPKTSILQWRLLYHASR